MGSKEIRDLVRGSLQRGGFVRDENGYMGAIKTDHINAAAQQRGGRVSASGGAGRERQIHHDHIDAQNKRVWPYGAEMHSRNRKQKTGVQGGVKGSNGSGPDKNWYSAGRGRARG